MKNKIRYILLFLLLFVGTSSAGIAQAVSTQGSDLVPHPAAEWKLFRSQSHWKRGVGKWGESTVREKLKLWGFNEIHEPRLPGNRGMDLLAIDRNSSGNIKNARIVEVKTHRNYGRPQLSTTSKGRQMSNRWIQDRIQQMRTSSNSKLQTLGDDLHKYLNRNNTSPNKLGRVAKINTRSGKLTIRSASSKNIISQDNLKLLFHNLKNQSPQQAIRNWATRHLSSWDHIQSTNMTNWLKQRSLLSRLFPRNLSMARLLSTRVIGTVGMIAAATTLALDFGELYFHLSAYVGDRISFENMLRRTLRFGGAMAGAWAGAIVGSYIGGQIGALTGPAAIVAAPSLMFIGGSIGGIAGYFLGQQAGDYAADLWYEKLDGSVRNSVDQWIQNTNFNSINPLQK